MVNKVLSFSALVVVLGSLISAAGSDTVDFRYSPPEWQAAICLPDDPQKSLVARNGTLFNAGPRMAIEVTDNAVWKKQELYSPRVPIVKTYRSAPGLEIVEEAFAFTDEASTSVRRTDGGVMQCGWAKPPLPDIALHNNGSIRFEIAGGAAPLALALCEAWWSETGKRLQILRVEGCAPKTVDTVADIGKDKVAVFRFDGRDTNGDGKIEVTVDAAPQAFDKNTILNGLWILPAGERVDDATLLGGKLKNRIESGRTDAILVHVTNTGKEARTLQPALIRSGNRSPLEPLAIPSGKTAGFSVGAPYAETVAARKKAIEFWERKAALPFGKIEVPDSGIQALVDSSIRNIWQAREIKNGLPCFQVGPTCYRGLWIVDGAFILESAAILGAGDQARSGVAYELSQQKPSGAFEVLSPTYFKENGIVLWTCIRHALLTQDKAWLESVWPKLEAAATYIRRLRGQTLENGTPLDDGLIPPGEIDGGLGGGGRPEFSNTYWNLLGLKAFIQAAHWLGKADQAAVWQKEYDNFMAAFRKAAERDRRVDPIGNAYLPTLMGENGPRELPQRAQWAFCHGVYPGQIFAKDDPLVAGNMKMLEATEREGMVYGTGWDATGIWNYFASFYAHAWLWQGDGRKAAEILYAYANHAAPVFDWREEQSLRGEKYKEVGDMPHNWASAEFIRLVVHLLALDRGDELHLFEGLPPQWIQPGMVTKLNGIATPFGPLTMELQVSDDGKTAKLRVEPLSDPSCRKIVVHLGDLIELNPGQKTVRTVPLPQAPPAAPREARRAAPLVAPAFTPLRLGAVEPQGWLRDWASDAKNGITGHLDERHPVFHDGWKGTPIQWTGANADGTGWPIEQSAYWLDGAIRLGFILHDDALIKKVRERLDPVVDGVNKADFGTTFVYWKKDWKPQGFNDWAHSQLGRALFALYSGSGEKRVLDALVKVYEDYPSSMGWPDVNSDVAGLCNLDAMMETCAASGDPRILGRALAAINRDDVQQRIREWRDGRVTPGHMVITYEDIRIPALLYPWTGRPELLEASKGVFCWLDQKHMLPYGLASGEEWAAGVGAARKTETCNIPAMLVSANWLYRIEGDGSWGDRMEKAFFNAGPSPVSRDWQTAAYYQSPNRIRLGELPVESSCPGKGGIAFGPLACSHVLCCIGACNRILPYFIPNLWMATSDGGLAATLYGPCTVSAAAGSGVPVKIACSTDYPFNESVRIALQPEKPVEFPLYLRIPAWCSAPALRLNGQPIEAQADSARKGFVRLSRLWKDGDVVELLLPMKATVERGFEGSYPAALRGYFNDKPATLFQPRALPYASVHYGPLLFALPIPEKNDNEPADGARWQFALDLHPRDAARIEVRRSPMPAHWSWPIESSLSLRVPAAAFDWKPTIAQALPDRPVADVKSEDITLIPYGCTKFHISMFPVTPKTWQDMSAPLLPAVMGTAGVYDDPASTSGSPIGYIDKPGCGVEWRSLPAGQALTIRYAAQDAAQLTLRVNDGPQQKVKFPATGKWSGRGAYADIKLPLSIPAQAVVRFTFESGDVPANLDTLEVLQ